MTLSPVARALDATGLTTNEIALAAEVPASTVSNARVAATLNLKIRLFLDNPCGVDVCQLQAQQTEWARSAGKAIAARVSGCGGLIPGAHKMAGPCGSQK